MITQYIEVGFQFEGTHFWPDAPASEAFLRTPHRHDFICRARLEVRHSDRELEFFAVKRYLDNTAAELPFQLGTCSCEQLARHFLDKLAEKYGRLRNMQVEVSEDGANTSILKYKVGP